LLIVNTASKCGFTPQYKELEAFYEKNKSKGFEILGFPANDFMGQEPGSDQEIQQFCSTKFNVTFPMFSKISVKGKNSAPLYKFLTQKKVKTGNLMLL
jgi:glutathione peroxidase